MQEIVIFGAGQSGRMIRRLLNGKIERIWYADNNYRNLPSYVDNVLVISPKEIVDINPDMVIVSVLNKEAAEEICSQLSEQDICKSKILNINSLRNLFDIRLATLRLQAQEINNKKIEGSIAELGVYKGYIARELNILFKERKLYLFDTFEGFDNRDIEYERTLGSNKKIINNFSDTSVERVKSILPYPENVVFSKGYFPETAVSIEDKFALVSLDTDLYLPTLNGLRYFYKRLSNGGRILVHDYNSSQFPLVKKAVDDFSKELDIKIIPLCDLHGSAVII
ncbi:MAG TPA: hypothetical protein GX396_04085 [Tissierellia bacterium]|nr:hypothetical protein [Tissierellia bacterium]